MTGQIHLRPATGEDVPLIMATERLPGYAELVGRWDEARHQQAMSDGRHAYFIAWDTSELIGFAILRDWNFPEQVTLIKRVAVASPGQGYGRALLRAVTNATFTETETYRL